MKSNYPALDSGRVFRLDWFDLFLNFIVLMLIVVALFTKVIHQVWPRRHPLLLLVIVCGPSKACHRVERLACMQP